MKTLFFIANLIVTMNFWHMTAAGADAPASDIVSASTLLNKVSEVTLCAFTLEMPLSTKISRGLADFRGIDPMSAITENSLANITDLRSAIRILELAFPNYVVGTSIDLKLKLRILNIIHRDLIGASPLDRELTNFTFGGTLARFDQLTDTEPALADFHVLSEPYSPGSYIVLLNDSTQIAFTKYSGRVRGLLSAAVLQYDPKKMFLWKATVQASGSSTSVSIDFYPDGGGARVR